MPTSIPIRQIDRLLAAGFLFFTLVGLGVEVADYSFGHRRLLGFASLFSLLEEANVPTWYSAVLLLCCGFALLLIGSGKARTPGSYRRHWLVLGAIFIYMSLDETASLHETTIGPVREFFGLSGIFYYAWTIPAAAVMAVILLSYLGFLRHLPAGFRNRFLLAGAIYVTGAFLTEFPISYRYDEYGADYTYALMNVVQESLEILGASVFLASLLRYLNAAWAGEDLGRAAP